MRLALWLGMLVTAVAFAAGCGSSPGTGRPGGDTPAAVQSAGTTSPQLQFAAKTVDGADFSGQSLAGKPAVLWFWAPWCPVCQREAPAVANIAHANAGVTFVGVAAQDQVPAMRDFVSKYNLGFFPHLADLDASVWQRFGVTVQPAFAFIGRDGSVNVVKNSLSEQDLAARVGTLAAA